jgi:hypothetical protein
MIRHSSRRFISRHDHTYPEYAHRIPRVTRRIELVSARSAPRSGPQVRGAVEEARR